MPWPTSDHEDRRWRRWTGRRRTIRWRRSSALRRAVLLDRLDRTDEAEALLRQLAAAYPGAPQPLARLGDLLRGAAASPRRRRPMTRRWRASPARPPRRLAAVLRPRHRARARRRLAARRGRFPARARALARAALCAELPRLYLGRAGQEPGPRARPCWNAPSELRPQDGNIADSLGWVLYRLGDLPGAVTGWRSAVELEPRNSVINDHLGDAYWAAGRQREARFQWRRAADARPRAGGHRRRSRPSCATACRAARRHRPALAVTASLTARSPRRRRPRSTSTCTSPAGARMATTCWTAWRSSARRGDTLAADAGRRRCPWRSTGPSAAALAAEPDNLVLRAARALAAAAGMRAGAALRAGRSSCRSPPASAAARPMRRRRCGLLDRLWGSGWARRAGGDRRGAGRRRAGLPRRPAGAHAGHRRGAAAARRPCRAAACCWSIRGVALATPAVFRARAAAASRRPPRCRPAGRMRRRWRRAWRRCGNDLEAPAIALCPPIARGAGGAARRSPAACWRG